MDFVHSVRQAGTPLGLADAVHRRRRQGTVPLPCRSLTRCMAHASSSSCRRLPCRPTNATTRPAARGGHGDDPLSGAIREAQDTNPRFLAPVRSHTPRLHPRLLCSALLPPRAPLEPPLSRHRRHCCSTAEYHPPHHLQPIQLLLSDHTNSVKLENQPFLVVVRAFALPPQRRRGPSTRSSTLHLSSSRASSTKVSATMS